MPEQPIHVVDFLHGKSLQEQVEYLTNEVAKLQKILSYLLNGQLDFENIRARGIKAENIEAEAITTNELAANAVTTDKIAAGAVVADKISVSELSAISANLGTINAGSITSNTEIDVGTDARIGRYLYVNVSSSSGDKGIIFHDNGSTVARIDVESGDISIRSSGYVTLNGDAGSFANGGRIAVQGISVGIQVMGADGNPMTLTFNGGTLRDVDENV